MAKKRRGEGVEARVFAIDDGKQPFKQSWLVSCVILVVCASVLFLSYEPGEPTQTSLSAASPGTPSPNSETIILNIPPPPKETPKPPKEAKETLIT